MILILADKWDITVDFVVEKLWEKGHPFIRLNADDINLSAFTVSLPDLSIKINHKGIAHDLSNSLGVVWNRCPSNFLSLGRTVGNKSRSMADFVARQWLASLEALQLLNDVFWINDPRACYLMESKVRQLKLASEIGFAIPKTIITNNSDEAHLLFESSPTGVFVKAIYTPLIEGADSLDNKFIFAKHLDSLPDDCQDELTISPTVFQTSILPKRDIRVTMVGDAVHAVQITGQDGVGFECDWRTKEREAKLDLVDLPKDVHNRCVLYLKRSHLNYGAIDLAEQNGEYIFLEINPNGEWGWIQKMGVAPIAESLCDLMVTHDNKN